MATRKYKSLFGLHSIIFLLDNTSSDILSSMQDSISSLYSQALRLERPGEVIYPTGLLALRLEANQTIQQKILFLNICRTINLLTSHGLV